MKVIPLWSLDYGDDVWSEILSSDLKVLIEFGISNQEGSYKLNLGGIEFDPLLEVPRIPEGWEAVAQPEKDLYLIQFFAPTRDEWLDSLRSIGIEIVQYIHPFTYVVWSDSNQLQQASQQGCSSTDTTSISQIIQSVHQELNSTTWNHRM